MQRNAVFKTTFLALGGGGMAPAPACFLIIFKAPWNFFAVVFCLDGLEGLESLDLAWREWSLSHFLSSMLTNETAL